MTFAPLFFASLPTLNYFSYAFFCFLLHICPVLGFQVWLKVPRYTVGMMMHCINPFQRHSLTRCKWNRCQDLLNHPQRRQKDQNDGNGNNARGVPVILPSSYQGSPCNKNKQYNDVMAIVSVIGRPDFYHHYYTNLHWPEMTKHLLFNINLLNYPVLTSKVFKMFLKHVIDNLWQ